MGGAHGRCSGTHRKHPTPAYTTFPATTAPASAFGRDPSNTVRTNMSCLPYAHVDSNLRALAGQAEGFGRLAIGGLHGPLYHVTTLAGSLSPIPKIRIRIIIFFIQILNTDFVVDGRVL